MPKEQRDEDNQSLGLEASAALAEAEAAVALFAGRFRDAFRADIVEARASLAIARKTPGEAKDRLRRIFTICHDIKGQGATFGYALLTRIAAPVCDVLRSPVALTARDYAIVEAHLAALQFVIDRALAGDGGEIGVALTAQLARLAENNRPTP